MGVGIKGIAEKKRGRKALGCVASSIDVLNGVFPPLFGFLLFFLFLRLSVPTKIYSPEELLPREILTLFFTDKATSIHQARVATRVKRTRVPLFSGHFVRFMNQPHPIQAHRRFTHGRVTQ